MESDVRVGALYRNPSEYSIESAGMIPSERLPVEEEEYFCSYCGFTPKWIQRFKTILAFSFVVLIFNLLFGLFFIYFVLNIVNLERHFNLESKWTGFILSSYEIGFILTVIPVSFFIGQKTRPLWMSMGCVGMMVGCFVFCIPYFLFSPPKLYWNVNSSAQLFIYSLCDSDEALTDDRCYSEPNLTAVGIFLLGIVLMGSCHSGTSLAVPYIDDNSPDRRSALFIALTMCARMFGPVFGVILATLTNGKYVDLSDPGFGSENIHWIGAWWIGFFVIASLFIIPAVGFGGFPIKLNPPEPPVSLHAVKSTLTREEIELYESTVPQPVVEDRKFILADIPEILLTLIKNPVLVSRIIGDAFMLLGMIGFLAFLPKYVANYFQISPSRANIFAGVITLIAMGFSFGFGGYLIHYKKITFKTLLLLIIIGNVVWSLGNLLMLAFMCPSPKIYDNWRGSGCGQCKCSASYFDPVCQPTTKLNYFSACFAGCKELLEENQTFLNCTCQEGKDVIIPGMCLAPCSSIYGYLVAFFILSLLSLIPSVGNVLVTLRSVTPELKNCAVGLELLIVGLFAVIPSPILYGYLTDSSCIVWETSCNARGACKIYDNKMLSVRFHGICAAITICAVLPNIICYKNGQNMTFTIEDTGTRSAVRDERSQTGTRSR